MASIKQIWMVRFGKQQQEFDLSGHHFIFFRKRTETANLSSKSKTSQQNLEKMEKNSKLISIIRESNGISELNKSFLKNWIWSFYYRNVEISPDGWDDGPKGFLAVCIYLTSKKATNVTGTWTVSVVIDRSVKQLNRFTYVFDKFGQGFGYSKMIPRAVLFDPRNGCVPGNVLLLGFTVPV